MFKSKHTFSYEIAESDVEGVTPQLIGIQATGEVTLSELLELFEKYIKAVGYFPPENSHLEFVEDYRSPVPSYPCQEC